MNIRTKIFIANAVVSLLLLVVLTSTMSQFSSGIILDKAKEDVSYSISQLAQNIDSLLESYEKIVDSLYVSTELQDKLLRSYTNFRDAQETYLNYVQPYEEWIMTSRDILRFSIYTDNPTFQFAQVRYIDDEVKQSFWYKSTQGNAAALVKTWTLSQDDALLHNGVLRLTQKVHNANTGREMYLTIDIDDFLIRNLISRENEEQRFIIALPNGSVILDTGVPNPYQSKVMDLPFYDRIAKESLYSELYKDDNDEEYLLTAKTLGSRSSISGLKVIQLMPMDQMMGKVDQMKKLALLLLVISSIVSVIITFLISMSLTKRLMRFSSQMKTIDMENLTPTMEIKGRDEIAQLSEQFQQMMVRIHQLVHEVYVSDIARKELELSNREYELYALQAQINPHYLFNTLNAIRGSLLEKGDRENAEMIKLLAQSFRRVLHNPSEMILLSEDLEIVDAYLRIQVYRFGERLKYEIEVPRQLLSVSIPRLSLQTLIENTINHALERTEGGIQITIRAYKESERCVCITVVDNGPGITRERLADIESLMNDRTTTVKSKHVGLRNLHQRLQHMYGKDYGIRLESVEGLGTRVSLLLPTTADKEGDSC
ncbi:cache domain-containing sensor histidine kinase [Paenibacillus sp. 1001270B_150601_E10]|uniref:cache domain-containing sensor histidine kinase n=1 Tax=Paenibacillus sp. 1001270B_150601_E10 TaxID=2787079 RepID=UPI0018A0213B|nr:sensor histidine kinase [Paenibacillus sp. 1001270B_150601_E10]